MRTHGKNIEKCVEFAQRSGYNVVAVFREEGESGRTTDRTEFKKMLEYCYDKKNNVFAMISYKLDRFTRNAGDYAYLVKAFKKNIEVIFTDGIKTDTSVGKLMKTIEAGFAEFESDRIGERINDGNHKARRSGRYTFPRVILFSSKKT
jgi:DNA invertase Pin-like site-specific DNA recombinase